jgi:hypothetical protein
MRSYSPTALQNYAACPYKFFLQAIHKLAPREISEAIDELDPLQRGSLINQIQFELFERTKRRVWLQTLDEDCPYQVVLPRRQVMDDSAIMDFLLRTLASSTCTSKISVPRTCATASRLLLFG